MLDVLIMDSSVYMGREMKRQLEAFSDILEARAVANGEEARRIIASRVPDVLVIDEGVDGGMGFELLSRVRKNRAYDDMRVIAVTNSMTDEKIARAVELGVTYCMIKPVSPFQLHEKIIMVSSAKAVARADNYMNGDLFKRVNRLLNEYGIMPCVIGYQYLRMALYISIKRYEQGKLLLTKEVYPVIAKRYDTSRACVERAIRNAISCAWDNREYLSTSMRDFAVKPRNGQFIALLAQPLMEQLYDDALFPDFTFD